MLSVPIITMIHNITHGPGLSGPGSGFFALPTQWFGSESDRFCSGGRISQKPITLQHAQFPAGGHLAGDF